MFIADILHGYAVCAGSGVRFAKTESSYYIIIPVFAERVRIYKRIQTKSILIKQRYAVFDVLLKRKQPRCSIRDSLQL